MRQALLPILIAGTLLAASAVSEQDAKFIGNRRTYWAFQKPSRPAVPAVRSSWIQTPVDAFILEALTAKKLAPSPRLDKERLIRRATLDLTGLPPTPGEVSQFLADKSPAAYEKLIDRLMASPRYGERWALRWLDIVRYADTNGFELDQERTHAWRYRDYVIQSFNARKPYDRFVQEQLAGDELWPGNAEALIATGFLRAGPEHIVGGNQDEEMNRQEVLTEMTTATGAVFLGLTIHCARCHNHKFDPIPQSDYYRLQAVFAATGTKDVPYATDAEKSAAETAIKEYEARLAPLKKAIEELEKPYRDAIKEEKRATLEPHFKAILEIPKDKRSKDQERLAKEAMDQIAPAWDEVIERLPADLKAKRAGIRKQMHAIDLHKPDPAPAAYSVLNMDNAPDTHILKIGDHKRKLDRVEPGVLQVLSPPGSDALPLAPSGRRAAFAKWVTSKEHPLTARVMANRIWQFRMGSGLVATPNDFGALGARPSNQKLLDWLAVEFTERNWDVRAIDRMILLSSAYQQSATLDAAKSAIDADNKFYWRANRRRLEGETIRDSILANTGMLNGKMFGKPIKTPIEPEIYDLIFTEYETDNLWPLPADHAEIYRRSIYLLNKRSVRLPLLANFDQPDAMTSCAFRPTSTHALQALTLLNSDFVTEQSRVFAQALEGFCGPTKQGCQIDRAYVVALSRKPTSAEAKLARDFLKGGRNTLADFCLALFNRNEYVYAP